MLWSGDMNLTYPWFCGLSITDWSDSLSMSHHVASTDKKGELWSAKYSYLEGGIYRTWACNKLFKNVLMDPTQEMCACSFYRLLEMMSCFLEKNLCVIPTNTMHLPLQFRRVLPIRYLNLQLPPNQRSFILLLYRNSAFHLTYPTQSILSR